MAPAPSLQTVIELVEADAGDDQPLTRLSSAATMVRDLAEVGDAALGYFVDQARRAGHSWSEIGDALGVSKQAAQQRHTGRLAPGRSGASLERFTSRARHVVGAAEPIARQMGQDHIGTEHLLLAFYVEDEGIAARILVESGMTAEKAHTAVMKRSRPGPGAPDGRLPFSRGAVAIFSTALASALEFGHNYIGTEHLLLGVAGGDGPAAQILGAAGLTQQVIKESVATKLAAYVPRPANPSEAAAQGNRRQKTARKTGAVKRR
jgi:hypothetical protein